MRTRSLLLVFGLMLGCVASDVSDALTPVVPLVGHPGVSEEQLERVYVGAYEQSGFRLIERHKQDGFAGTSTIRLAFELTGASQADNVPGTTLEISSSTVPPCSPCQVSRLSYMRPDASNPSADVRARGEAALATADAAALAKVRRRLGVSLPEIPLSEVPAH